MIKVIIFIIAGLFTLYGICGMGRAMIRSIEKSKLCEMRDDGKLSDHSSRSEYFLLVQNCDHNIEWLVRNFYHSHPDTSVTDPGLTIVDIGSDDETAQIISLLCTKYEDLHIMTLQEFELYLKYDADLKDQLADNEIHTEIHNESHSH